MAKKKYKNIFEAIKADDIEAVKTFLPRHLNTKDKGGRTPLYWACINDSIEIVRLLLDNGADIMCGEGYILHLACIYGYYDIAELFVSRGADPMLKTLDGYTALDLATETVTDKDGNKVPHSRILLQLRAEYLNKQTIEKSERTAVITSGWEMEM